MKAWILNQTTNLTVQDTPLELVNLPIPKPKVGELLIKVKVCGICHTEIDEIEGRTLPPKLPIIPGHQVIGNVVKHLGSRKEIKIGDRVGVAWIFNVCGKCEYCLSGQENLCDKFIATGRDAHGGYAEYLVVSEDFVYAIPEVFSDAEAAPLLCAGAIGYRSLSLCNPKNGQNIGLTGFGASAHLVLKLIKYQYPGIDVYVFARSKKERQFAIDLGADWAGTSSDKPSVLLNSIIDTTPVWFPVMKALENLKHGGRLVINAIRKENQDLKELLTMDYSTHLWMEKEIKSVANVTRYDVSQFIKLASEMLLKPEVTKYAFEDANKALLEIKERKIKGAKVLIVE